MRSILAAAILGAASLTAAPAFAQGIYIGPGGVGVDTGVRHGYGYGDRGYYRGRDDYRYDRRYDRSYEGRSAYEGRGRQNYFYDHY